MQRDVKRLLRRFAILALLVMCTVVVSAERQSSNVAAADFCGYCTPFRDQCYSGCGDKYSECIIQYSQTYCDSELYACELNCDDNLAFCQEFCNTGGGGGSGGPWPKGSCGANCYDARADCLMDDPAPYWIEDCLNEGGNRHTCCSTVFYDCMAGC